MTDRSVRLPRLPARNRDSHKGDFGRVFLIGGSVGMTGSISLSGMAALRSGSGLVTIGTPAACVDSVAGFEPSYMTYPLAEQPAGRLAARAATAILEFAENQNCLGIGPGLGRSQAVTRVVHQLVGEIRTTMVIDADGLNALADDPSVLGGASAHRILTPHPGEFQRLAGETFAEREVVEEAAHKLAAKWNCVIVLKGRRTLVTDGERTHHNSTGNPGLATGGTGDVLTGVISSFVGQGLEPYHAARLGVYVHGRAGDLAAHKLGEAGMIASDLLQFLPSAIREVTE